MGKRWDNLLGGAYYLALVALFIGLPIFLVRADFKGTFVALMSLVAINAVLIFDLREYQFLSRGTWTKIENPFCSCKFSGTILQTMSYVSLIVSVLAAVII